MAKQNSELNYFLITLWTSFLNLNENLFLIDICYTWD